MPVCVFEGVAIRTASRSTSRSICLVVAMRRQAGVLVQHTADVADRIADRRDLDARVHVGDRQVREAHLPDPDDARA